jgi:hypothetical protein
MSSDPLGDQCFYDGREMPSLGHWGRLDSARSTTKLDTLDTDQQLSA